MGMRRETRSSRGKTNPIKIEDTLDNTKHTGGDSIVERLPKRIKDEYLDYSPTFKTEVNCSQPHSESGTKNNKPVTETRNRSTTDIHRKIVMEVCKKLVVKNRKSTIGGHKAPTKGSTPVKQSSYNVRETHNKPVTEALKPVMKNSGTRNEPVTEALKPVIESSETRNEPVTGTFKPVTETRNEPVTVSDNKPVTENSKILNKLILDMEYFSLQKVSPYQRKIILTLFDEIQKNPLKKETGPLKIRELGRLIQLRTVREFESLRIVILKLEKMNTVLKTEVKTGRSGWTKYALPSHIFSKIIKWKSEHKTETVPFNKPVTENSEILNKPVTETRNKPVIEGPSSSSYIKETTTERFSVSIPDALVQLNFNKNLIDQVLDRNLISAENLQNSLDAYAFDISENKINETHKIKDPVRYFMGILNKKTPYIAPSNYVSDENKALLENKKRLEGLKKAQIEAVKVKDELIYREWLEGLTKAHKTKIVPEDTFIKIGTSFHEQLLASHYNNALTNGLSPNDASVKKEPKKN